MTLNPSRRGGCLTQLAVALLVVVVIVALIIGGTLFYAYRQGVKYTTDVPPPPPEFTKSDADAQYELLKPRLEELSKEQKALAVAEDGSGTGMSATSSEATVTTGTPRSSGDLPPPTIRLSPADLNALAYRANKKLPSDAYINFSIAGERLILNASFPLKGVPLLGGRYFVGTISLSEPPAGYPLPLYLDSATAGGEALPEGLISRFQDPAQARKFLNDNGLGDELGEVRSIRIEPDAIVVEMNRSN
ncbi:MAG: hypothetical protein R3F07_08740 [Opitutaceae bacterium]